MADLLLGFWAITPPLILFAYYCRRVPSTLSLPQLLFCFGVGAICGLVSLALAGSFELLANWLIDWQQITQSLAGVALRQLLAVSPIEEGSKLAGVILIQRWRWYPLARRSRWQLQHPASLLLATIAIALGFTAEENWIYLANGTATVFDRLIGTPVHALFSAPWGYALGVASCSIVPTRRYYRAIARSVIVAVIYHALVNVLSSAWRYSPPLNLLSYGLFPFLLWLFWRLEQLLRRVRGQLPLVLISAATPTHQWWQRGLVLFALILSGNAIFGLFLLSRTIEELWLAQAPVSIWLSLTSPLALDLIFGLIAWVIYRYLRLAANRRHHF